MQRKFFLAIMLAVAVAVTGGSLAFAGGASRHDGEDDVRILQLTTRLAQEATVDPGPVGPQAGDRFVFSTDVYRHGERVGAGGVDCVTVRSTSGPADERLELTDQCVGTLSLPRGQITVQGLLDRTSEEPAFHFAVTGGTGAYRTAHGEANLPATGPNEQGEERLTLKLIL